MVTISRRLQIIIALVVAAIIILLLVLLFWWLYFKEQKPLVATNTNVGLQIPENLPSAATSLPAVPLPESESDLATTLKAIALTFAERFGSYSNEGNFSNFDDLRDLMTVRMKVWSDNYQTNQQQLPEQIYYGITTKALSAQIQHFDETTGRATVLVNTQRQQAQGTTINPEVFYQKINLQLVKTGEGWKVDAAEWQ